MFHTFCFVFHGSHVFKMFKQVAKNELGWEDRAVFSAIFLLSFVLVFKSCELINEGPSDRISRYVIYIW